MKILAIDQGTTSSRAIVFSDQGEVLCVAQHEFTQHYPQLGWVEHDPEEIWQSTLNVCREVLAKVPKVAAVGISNQRETTIVWDRATGKAIYPAIVWQDRRTAEHCQRLRDAGHEPTISKQTGLLLDPYFSATKIAWILDHVEGARTRAERGELAAGTVDSYLIWQLTGGNTHATDASNASRTLLFDIHRQQWDKQLLEIFKVPPQILPEVRDSAADFGSASLLQPGLPISGVAGDQQAAAIGQACFDPGSMKSTYGTGCFALLNTGTEALRSKNRLLTTVAYRLQGKTHYALEGSIFVAGAAVQWLRDKLGIIDDAAQTQSYAGSLSDNRGVYLVPAFTGLGAPHWNPHARGAIFGLTRDTGPAELARAALESVCYQTRDLLDAMAADGARYPKRLRIDGGMVTNDWLAQYLADILEVEIQRPHNTETTALGAAYLAGLQIGIYNSLDDIASQWKKAASFRPAMDNAHRQQVLQAWKQAVRCVNMTSHRD